MPKIKGSQVFSGLIRGAIGEKDPAKIIQYFKAGAGMMIATLALDAVVDTVTEVFKSKNKKFVAKKAFKKMMAVHPKLHKVDPNILSLYWESLYHFAPHMARDPLASGAYIRQSIERGHYDSFGGPPPDTFSTLVGVGRAPMKPGKGPGLSDMVSKELVQGAFDGLAEFGKAQTSPTKYNSPFDSDIT
jgi:hypothetical protein